MQTYVILVYKPVIQFFLTGWPAFKSKVILFRNQPKWFESWLNGRKASWINQTQWKLYNLARRLESWPTKLSVAQTAWPNDLQKNTSKVVSQPDQTNASVDHFDSESSLCWRWLGLAYETNKYKANMQKKTKKTDHWLTSYPDCVSQLLSHKLLLAHVNEGPLTPRC